MQRRVISVPGQKTRERQGGVVHRPRLHAAVFKAANSFAGHLVRPGARFSCRLVGAVKLQNDLVLGGVLQERLIEIDYLFGFMIEEIDLRADNANVIAQGEKLSPVVRSSEGAAMFPKPYPHFLLF